MRRRILIIDGPFTETKEFSGSSLPAGHAIVNANPGIGAASFIVDDLRRQPASASMLAEASPVTKKL
jgi:hypothetical protein